MKTGYLNYELWSDINLIKCYQETENSQLRRTLRIKIDQTKIKGKFIINIYIQQTFIINFTESSEIA